MGVRVENSVADDDGEDQAIVGAGEDRYGYSGSRSSNRRLVVSLNELRSDDGIAALLQGTLGGSGEVGRKRDCGNRAAAGRSLAVACCPEKGEEDEQDSKTGEGGKKEGPMAGHAVKVVAESGVGPGDLHAGRHGLLQSGRAANDGFKYWMGKAGWAVTQITMGWGDPRRC